MEYKHENEKYGFEMKKKIKFNFDFRSSHVDFSFFFVDGNY